MPPSAARASPTARSARGRSTRGRHSGTRYSPVDHGDALGAQAAGMVALVPGDEPSTGADHAPPRKAVPVAQDVADGARRAGMPRLLGNLAIRDHVAGPQPAQHDEDVLLERHRVDPAAAKG